jgi:outer membrane immunogenic protein
MNRKLGLAAVDEARGIVVMDRKHLLCGVAAAALMMTGAVQARATDAPEVPMSVERTWQGLYAGVHAGFGASVLDLAFDSDGSTSAAIPNGGDGGLFGAHAGFNWQRDRLVFGVEGDVDWTSMEGANVGDHDSDDFAGEVKFLASIRGRLGVDMDGTLAYVTAGWAFTDSTQTFHAGSSDAEPVEHDNGAVIGAGLEHRISDRLSVRAEGLYYFFGDEDYICATSCGTAGTGADVGDLDLNVVVFRVGLTGHFSM